MTSTNFHVGLPEGDGPKRPTNAWRRTHTDIFGAPEPVQQTPKKHVPPSNIKNILMEVEEADGKKSQHDANAQKENKPENGSANQGQTPQRVRMPPGGFSSGLW